MLSNNKHNLNVKQLELLKRFNKLINYGFCLIPLKQRDKRPQIAWNEYQTRKPTQNEIVNWIRKYPEMNIGIVTGEISGITVVDIDKEDIPAGFSPTWTVKTSKGHHLYYQYDPEVKTGTNSELQIDIRSDGGYVVAPESTHPSGVIYEWTINPDFGELATLSETELQILKTEESKSTWRDRMHQPIERGGRDEALTSICGGLMNEYRDNLHFARQELSRVNIERCIPPLDIMQVEKIWNSIYPKHKKSIQEEKDNHSKSSHADKLINLLSKREDIEYFTDQKNEPYIKFINNDIVIYYSIFSRKIDGWLRQAFHNKYGRVISGTSLSDVKGALAGKAEFDGEQLKLSPRVALHNNSYWYDLSDDGMRAIRIDENGWEVVNHPPILFARSGVIGAQTEPSKEGDIKRVLKYFSFKRKSQEILLITTLVTYLLYDQAHVITYFHGPQGSAKSTRSKIIKDIIDPSILGVTRFPKKIDDLLQGVSQSWLSAYDNVSYISDETSDDLCRIATGGTILKRKLYSDDEQIVFEFKRPLVINGIPLAALKSDLLERSLLFELERIPPHKRKTESELKMEFKEDLPHILGGCFDALSRAIKLKKEDDANAVNLSRMADHDVWGRYIAEAIGYSPEEFIKALAENKNDQTYEAITSTPIGEAIISLMDEVNEWKDSPSNTLTKLHAILEKDRNVHFLPEKEKISKNAANLTKKIKELIVPFSQIGIEIDIGRNAHERYIVITKNDKSDSNDGQKIVS